MNTAAQPELMILPQSLAVCFLPPAAPFPQWALSGDLLALTRTKDELSVVCSERLVPSDIIAERNWRAIQVAGPLDFSLVGILASIASPLAQAGISIFAISTYQTDYILLKEDSLAQACKTLAQAGFVVIDDVNLLA